MLPRLRRTAAFPIASIVSITVLALIGIGLLAPPSRADTIRVTRTDDPKADGCRPSSCSLREAIALSSRDRERDRVIVRAGRTYRLSGARGELRFKGDLTLTAAGRGRARIDARRVKTALDSRARQTTLRLSHLDVLGSRRDSIYVFGDAVVRDSLIRASGGTGITSNGLDLFGSVVRRHAGLGVSARRGGRVIDSRVAGNRFGGLDICGVLVMRESIVRDNRRGVGVEMGDDDKSSPACSGSRRLQISNSQITNNGSLGGGGGGIYTPGFPVGGIRNSDVVGNDGARGGIDGGGELRIVQSRIAHNTGDPDEGAGGITGSGYRIVRSTIRANEGRVGGAFISGSRLRASTVAGNTALRNGGGVDVGSGVEIVNSTIAENSAAQSGGGVFVNQDLEMRSSTVTSNVADSDGAGDERGGGVFVRSDLDLGSVVTDSIVASNSLGPADEAEDCSGPFDVARRNMLTVIGEGCTGFGTSSNIVTDSPGLRPLGPYGGWTETVALSPSSPAIGEASPRFSPRSDQRGVERDRRPDIGAFERR